MTRELFPRDLLSILSAHGIETQRKPEGVEPLSELIEILNILREIVVFTFSDSNSLKEVISEILEKYLGLELPVEIESEPHQATEDEVPFNIGLRYIAVTLLIDGATIPTDQGKKLGVIIAPSVAEELTIRA